MTRILLITKSIILPADGHSGLVRRQTSAVQCFIIIITYNRDISTMQARSNQQARIYWQRQVNEVAVMHVTEEVDTCVGAAGGAMGYLYRGSLQRHRPTVSQAGPSPTQRQAGDTTMHGPQYKHSAGDVLENQPTNWRERPLHSNETSDLSRMEEFISTTCVLKFFFILMSSQAAR